MSDEPLSGRQAERLGNASSANQAVNIFSPSIHAPEVDLASEMFQ
jgi:hypothetical protein